MTQDGNGEYREPESAGSIRETGGGGRARGDGVLKDSD